MCILFSKKNINHVVVKLKRIVIDDRTEDTLYIFLCTLLRLFMLLLTYAHFSTTRTRDFLRMFLRNNVEMSFGTTYIVIPAILNGYVMLTIIWKFLKNTNLQNNVYPELTCVELVSCIDYVLFDVYTASS